MARDPLLYLEDILEAILKIETYTAGMTRDDFENNSMAGDAVVRNLEIIGEAAKNLSDDVKAQTPDVPWERVMGLRNIIAHEYFGIDFDIIWVIVTENLPKFKPQVKALLQ